MRSTNRLFVAFALVLFVAVAATASRRQQRKRRHDYNVDDVHRNDRRLR